MDKKNQFKEEEKKFFLKLYNEGARQAVEEHIRNLLKLLATPIKEGRKNEPRC